MKKCTLALVVLVSGCLEPVVDAVDAGQGVDAGADAGLSRWAGVQWKDCGPTDAPTTSLLFRANGAVCGDGSNEGFEVMLNGRSFNAGDQFSANGGASVQQCSGGTCRAVTSGLLTIEAVTDAGLRGAFSFGGDAGVTSGRFETGSCAQRDVSFCG